MVVDLETNFIQLEIGSSLELLYQYEVVVISQDASNAEEKGTEADADKKPSRRSKYDKILSCVLEWGGTGFVDSSPEVTSSYGKI